MAKRKLTAKQRKFVDKYVETGNAKEAAIEAGYSINTAKQMGTENLSKPVLKEAIEARMAEMASNTIASAKEVLEYYTKVIRGTARETVVVDGINGPKQVDNPPTIKDRLAAGKELLKRYPENDQLLKAQIAKLKADARKSKAEADISEARASQVTAERGQSRVVFIDSEEAMRQYMEEHPDEYEHTGK